MTEESAGIIPIHKETKEILLVQHRAGHWGFPKGHLEGSEKPIDAALRELREETGIADVAVFGNPIVRTYSFQKDGIDVEKIVTYFPGIVESKEVKIKEDEIKGYAWLSYEEAKNRLTFSKEVLDELHL